MKPGTVFHKMSGSGNDFVMFDGRHVSVPELTPDAIVRICCACSAARRPRRSPTGSSR